MAVAVAVLGLALRASSQVAPVQTGNVLDSNFNTSSGGTNTPVAPSTATDSQLYINRQTTGLSSFRGRVGYFPSDQLRLRLPSAGLSSFQRESVGVNNVLAGQTMGGSPYYDRSSTVIGPAGIAAGLNAPGTNMPRSSLSLPQGRQLYNELTSEYKSVLAVPLAVPPVAPAGRGAAAGLVGPRKPSPLDPASAADIDRFRRPVRETDLAQELRNFNRVQGPLDERLDVRIEALLAPAGPRDSDPRRRESPLPPLAGTDDRAEEPAPAAGAVTPRSAPTLRPDQDVFMDLMDALQRQRVPSAAPPAGSGAGVTTRPSADPGSRVVQSQDGSVVIRSLAGQDRGLFNYHMAKAQEKLKAGRYYDAAEEFHLAGMSDARNPMAHVGMCLSMLGAGEPLPAARHLRTAMETFPPLMEAQIDLHRFLDAKPLEQAMAHLDGLVGQDVDNNRPGLALLAAYLHHSLNHDFLAKAAARKLKDAAGKDKLAAALAELVLTGKRPAEK